MISMFLRRELLKRKELEPTGTAEAASIRTMNVSMHALIISNGPEQI